MKVVSLQKSHKLKDVSLIYKPLNIEYSGNHSGKSLASLTPNPQFFIFFKRFS